MDSETLPDFTVRHGVDLNECLEDSPDFREHLEQHEKEIGDLETGLEKMVQLCGGMVSAGHKYKQACRDFGAHIKEMAAFFTTSEKVVEMFKTTSDLFSDLNSYFSVLFDQMQRSVQNALKNYLVCEIGKLRESKRSFDRISDEYNTALHKNAQAAKSKPLEAEEATKLLQVTSVAFSVVAMDHVYQINCLQSKKGFEVLEKVASMLRAQLRFFNDGCERLKKFEPVIEQMGAEIDAMKKESTKEVKKMEGRHNLVKKLRSPDSKEKLLSSPPLSASSSDGEENIALKGFLFKRGSSKFKMWNRRYFVMKDNQLQYQKKGPTKETHVVAEDLRLCAVKNAEDMERRFCFEIVAPTKSFLLQADSEVIRRKWMSAIQASVATAFRQTMAASTAVEDGDVIKRSPITTTTTDPARVSKRLTRVAGNDRCADCGDINPSWASINLGVLLCIECSGIHRSLGVHISKVRSVTLDAWESEVLRVMTKLGNRIANSILEYEVPEGMVKSVANSTRAEKERWIKAKYVQHSFVHPHTSVPDIQTCSLVSSTEQTPYLAVNKPLIIHSEDLLADDSAPESEYDSKSLKRKKKQNKIRRWAMDKLVKRGSTKEGGTVGKEMPSIVSEGDDVSITSKDGTLTRTLPLRERKATFSVGEMPPPKPPRTKKTKSVIMETSVTEPLLSTEDPTSEEWYKSGSLFETDDFCDSIMEVIKNIGYTCDSPASSMMQSDGETRTDSPGLNVHHRNNQCEEEVIANGNVLASNSPINKTLTVETRDLTDSPINKTLTVETRDLTDSPINKTLTVKTRDFTDSPIDTTLTVETQDPTESRQPSEHLYEEIPDEFQRYNGEDKVSTESLQEEASTCVTTTRTMKEKSVSASDVSLEFFSAHSSPINTLDSCSSPVQEPTEPILAVTRKPAKKLETTAWVSEDSSNEASSGTNLLQDSPPLSKAPMTNVSPNISIGDGNVTQNSVNIEISEAGGVTKDSEPCGTPGESDTGPSYTIVKGNLDTDVSSSTLVAGNTAPEENTEATPLTVEVTSSTPEITSSTPEMTSSNPEVTSIMTDANINSGTASPVVSSALTLPPEGGDPFTSDEELDDNGRPSSTPEPIIIPLSKSAHEFLYSSAKKGSLPGMLCALAHGANVNFMNPNEELKCPLIASILAESLESTEFLLQNGAKLHLRDSRGRGCLHHAASIGAVGHVCLLLKRGTIAHLHSVDEMGKDALDIAVEQGNADIVTLLRLAKLNDSGETVDEIQNKALQETVSLVYRDIKHSATDSMDSPTMCHPPVETSPITSTNNN